jgi:hypothetical protein
MWFEHAELKLYISLEQSHRILNSSYVTLIVNIIDNIEKFYRSLGTPEGVGGVFYKLKN